jgi:tetratricopeptide (TPR) repeat protein
LTELKEAVQLDPTSLQAYLFLGMAAKESGDFDRALNSLSCAPALNPNLFPAYVGQGIVLFRMGRLEDGFQQLDSALELGPQAAQGGGNVDEAIRELQKVIELLPQSARARYNLALA